jgi:hypothetical protein
MIVVAGNAIKRRLDAAKYLQGLPREFCLLHQVASETNEIRSLRVDRPNYSFQISPVTFVMNVRYLHESVPRRFAHPHLSHREPRRLQPRCVRRNSNRRTDHTRQELPAAEPS